MNTKSTSDYASACSLLYDLRGIGHKVYMVDTPHGYVLTRAITMEEIVDMLKDGKNTNKNKEA